MQSREKLTAFAYGVGALYTLGLAVAMPEVRTVMLAVCLGLGAQLPVSIVGPMTRGRRPPMSLVGLEGGLAGGAVVASVLASPWFVLPAVTTLLTTTGLALARRADQGPSSPEAASEPPAEAPRSSIATVEEFLTLRPGLRQLGAVLRITFLSLAALCVLMATADPMALIGAAVFAAMAGSVRLAEWLSAKTMPPWALRDLQQLRRERELARQADEPTP